MDEASENSGDFARKRHWTERFEEIASSNWFRIAFGLLVSAIGISVLHHLASEISWHDVKMDLAATPAWKLGAGLAFTALSFLAISGYDVLAIRRLGGSKIPAHIAALTGAAGFAVSNLFGFSWLTGGILRSRVYARYGIETTGIAALIGAIWYSLTLAIAILLSIFLTFQLVQPGATFSMPGQLQTVSGIAIALAVAGTLFAVWRRHPDEPLRVGVWTFPLPTFPQTIRQILLSFGDLVGASLALYILLPSDLGTGFATFFIVYVAAIGLGVASHAPGGVGVFEATMMAGLGAGGRSDVLAALLVYRMVYYVVPFLVTVLAFAVLSALRAAPGTPAGKPSPAWLDLTDAGVPLIAAGLTFLAGFMLLASGSLPGEESRLRLLEDVLPLGFIEISHLLASIAGLFLLILARGLFLRRARAWKAAMILLLVGGLSSLLKGFDWEEAAAAAIAAAVLFAARRRFYRQPPGNLTAGTWQWLAGIFVVLAISVWIGFLAYSHVEYNNSLWWQFAWNGDAPRFMRASLVVAVLFSAVLAMRFMDHGASVEAADTIPPEVTAIISRSANADAWLALTGDKNFVLSPDRQGFVAFADTGRSLIARGDPIGPVESAAEAAWEFRELADRMGRRCAFYSISQDLLPLMIDMGMTVLKIGEVAKVNLPDFTLEGPAKKNLRYAWRRADKDGYLFEVFPRERFGEIAGELRSVSDAWLLNKQGSEKSFTMGSFSEPYLANFDHALLRAPDGSILAFANLLQSGENAELTLDLMRYRPDSPGFIMEALFANICMWGKQTGYRRFSLGAAPLSGMEGRRFEARWNRLAHEIYERGERFYHFEGLRAFKAKFDPEWSGNYLACRRALDAPALLLEVNGLISGGVRGLLKKGGKK